MSEKTTEENTIYFISIIFTILFLVNVLIIPVSASVTVTPSDITQITDNNHRQLNPNWSPDGTKITYSSYINGIRCIFVMNPDGTENIQITEPDINRWGPSWTPDSKQIIFASYGDNKAESIFIMDVDGTNIHKITPNEALKQYSGTMSPDGKKILFISFGTEQKESIFTMNPDGTGIKKLSVDDTSKQYNPAWSPDGKKIAFRSYHNEIKSVFVMNSDGSDVKPITNSSTNRWDPEWSPDGKKIAFVGYGDKKQESIYVMNADGSDMVKLSPDGSNRQEDPSWSPDGTKIAFKSYGKGGSPGIFVMDLKWEGEQPPAAGAYGNLVTDGADSNEGKNNQDAGIETSESVTTKEAGTDDAQQAEKSPGFGIVAAIGAVGLLGMYGRIAGSSNYKK